MVFDAQAGLPVSLNREARRIVDGLRNPDHSAEQLLKVVAYRRAYARAVSREESPLTQALSPCETLRAKEVVLQVPNGRSATTLVNATPIRSEAGDVESVIVTFQDMTPLEEQERLRAEFLGLVAFGLCGFESRPRHPSHPPVKLCRPGTSWTPVRRHGGHIGEP